MGLWSFQLGDIQAQAKKFNKSVKCTSNATTSVVCVVVPYLPTGNQPVVI